PTAAPGSRRRAISPTSPCDPCGSILRATTRSVQTIARALLCSAPSRTAVNTSLYALSRASDPQDGGSAAIRRERIAALRATVLEGALHIRASWRCRRFDVAGVAARRPLPQG